jgi:hypothetical protein
MALRASRFPVNIYMQECKLAISFHLCGELNGLVGTVRWSKKPLSLLGLWGQLTNVSSI